MTVVRGRFMDGRTAEDRSVMAFVEGAELVVASADAGTVLARWGVSGIHVDAMQEGGVVHVETRDAPGALLSLESAQLLDSLREGGARVVGLHRGRRGRAIAVASFLSFCALMAGSYFAAPAITAAIARRIPVETEREIAPGMQSLFARQTCDTPDASKAISRMLERLDPERTIPVDVRLVNLDMANAFALPGSVVVLTRGLVEEADTAEEVAGVLAHELAHVKHRHALAHMLRNTLLGALWALTLGDYAGLMVIDPKTAYDAASLRFSRDAEAEADATALEMMTARGVSAQGVVAFFERHAADAEEGMSWLSSHPAPADRIARFSEQPETAKGAPVLDEESLYLLRIACDRTPQVSSLKDLFD